MYIYVYIYNYNTSRPVDIAGKTYNEAFSGFGDDTTDMWLYVLTTHTFSEIWITSEQEILEIHVLFNTGVQALYSSILW